MYGLGFRDLSPDLYPGGAAAGAADLAPGARKGAAGGRKATYLEGYGGYGFGLIGVMNKIP